MAERAAGALLALVLLAGPIPAAAQMVAPSGSLELHGIRLSVTRDEMAALTDLGRLVNSAARGPQDNALARAQRAARGPDARYALATYQFAIGQRRRDDALSGPALDVLLASGQAPAHLLAGYVDARAGIALRAGDMAMADRLWTGLAGQRPNDPQLLFNLAQVRDRLGDPAGAMAFLQRAIAARAAVADAGPVPINWYRQQLSIAFNAGRAAEGVAAAQALLAAYPAPEQWRFALVAWRQLAAAPVPVEIVLMRLMRATGALTEGPEYLRFAQLLMRAGAVAEARAVYDEGIARGAVDRAGPNVAAIGAELDRAARRPQTVASLSPADAALTQAATLATGARRAAAIEAFRTIAAGNAQGVHADLARFWLIHLARP